MAESLFYVLRLRLVIIIFKIILFIFQIQLAVIHTADFCNLTIFVRVCTESNLIMRVCTGIILKSVAVSVHYNYGQCT
jgi:hypothetical protein